MTEMNDKTDLLVADNGAGSSRQSDSQQGALHQGALQEVPSHQGADGDNSVGEQAAGQKPASQDPAREVLVGDAADAPLSARDRFILYWGDLGGRWGVNKSVAQLHAYLLMSDDPRCAEEIAADLRIARSNVSTSLRELTTWGLIERAPVKGDRRDHYVAIDDVWEMAARIIDRRKAQEIDPARDALSACLANATSGSGEATGPAVSRLRDLAELFDLADDWYGRLRSQPRENLRPLMALGGRALKAVGLLSGGGRRETPAAEPDQNGDDQQENAR